MMMSPPKKSQSNEYIFKTPGTPAAKVASASHGGNSPGISSIPLKEIRNSRDIRLEHVRT